MTGYRRNFIAGGSFFFTVNLAERRLQLLTQHIDELRNAFRAIPNNTRLGMKRCKWRTCAPCLVVWLTKR